MEHERASAWRRANAGMAPSSAACTRRACQRCAGWSLGKLRKSLATRPWLIDCQSPALAALVGTCRQRLGDLVSVHRGLAAGAAGGGAGRGGPAFAAVVAWPERAAPSACRARNVHTRERRRRAASPPAVHLLGLCKVSLQALDVLLSWLREARVLLVEGQPLPMEARSTI